MLAVRRYAVNSGDGWVLDVRRVTPRAGADAHRPPVVFVPGYAMNTHILAYHPRGRSMVQYLCEGGYEVWLANLRGQGESVPRRRGAYRDIGLSDLSLVDLPAVMARIATETTTSAGRYHLVGCSLGGAIAFAYLAKVVDEHALASIVNLGGPFRWFRVHPVIAAAARRAALLSRVPVVGTRRMARAVLPLAAKVPILLSPYMNARGIDLSQARELVRTIDDPPAGITRDVGEWIHRGRLVVGGIDVESRLRGVELPILCVMAMADGLVPPHTVSVVREVLGGPVDLLEVGDTSNPFAHADLFANDEAELRVFAPMRDWLDELSES